MSKQIILTIDDHPCPPNRGINTNKVLDLLKKHNIKATFFLVGERIIKYPEIVLRIVDEGHQIANHSYLHVHLDTVTKQQASFLINKCQDILEKYADCSLFRPPYGAWRAELNDILEERKLNLMFWEDSDDQIYRQRWVFPVGKEQVIILSHGGVRPIQSLIDQANRQSCSFVLPNKQS